MGGKGHRQEKGWYSDPMDTFQVCAPRKSTLPSKYLLKIVQRLKNQSETLINGVIINTFDHMEHVENFMLPHLVK